MTDALAENGDLRSLGRHGLVGVVAIFGLFGGLIAWASMTDIAGAVVAGGTVMVESYAKSVQHQEGGTVREVLVRNEDAVKAGQVLIRLDDTVTSANLAIIEAQYLDALVQEARLVAEIEGRATFAVPAELTDNAHVEGPLATQQQIFVSQTAARDGRIAQLNEQVTQSERQIEGLEIQQKASERQLEILRREAAELAGLLDQQLVEASRVNSLGKALAAEEGESGRLFAAIAETRAMIAERRLQMAQIENDYVAEALNELQKVRQALAELREQRRAAQEKLTRTEIRSPQTGVVHESVVHTVGGVVSPGEVLMQIVPQDDMLLVGIRVDPMDVDKLATDQKVVLRLSSFDQRSTPEIAGAISAISPDFVQDRATGRHYYTARVTIADGELSKLPANVKLRPGMPVEAFVTTGDRSVLSYLIHPLVEQLNLAFRED